MSSQFYGINYLSVIGAQRSGSTFLYELLDCHPEIEMIKPARPEPRFFMDSSISTDKFIQFFSERADLQTKFIGEKCTSYIENPEVGEKIIKLFPNAKILVILRNPINRAISNYQFTKDNGLESRSMEEVFLQSIPPPIFNEKISVDPFDYIQRGYYSDYLKPYINIFKDRLKVVVFERLISEEDAQKEIFDFLELPYQDIDFANKTKKVNQSSDTEVSNFEEIYAKLSSLYKDEIPKLASIINIDLKKYW